MFTTFLNRIICDFIGAVYIHAQQANNGVNFTTFAYQTATMSLEEPPFLNLRTIIAAKDPILAKRIPLFMLNYLNRIVHVDEINHFLSIYPDKTGSEFVEAALNFLQISYQQTGLEKLSAQHRYLFVSNHPLGGLDGLTLMHCTGKKFEKIYFLANDILCNLPTLREIFLPVNKHGAQNPEYLAELHSAYASDAQIFTFPAGLCSRKKNGKIQDLKWHSHFIKSAVRFRRDVVPIRFSGRNSDFFYRLAKLRAMLRINTNIEMLYLVDEMFMQKNSQFTIQFGEPIPYATFDRSRKPEDWALYVRKIVDGMAT